MVRLEKIFIRALATSPDTKWELHKLLLLLEIIRSWDVRWLIKIFLFCFEFFGELGTKLCNLILINL